MEPDLKNAVLDGQEVFTLYFMDGPCKLVCKVNREKSMISLFFINEGESNR